MLKFWKNRSMILDGSGLSCHWKNRTTIQEDRSTIFWIIHSTVLLPAPS